MDPNANLEEQRQLIERMQNQPPGWEACDFNQDALRLAELVVELDGWIRNGGMLPKAWLKSCAVPQVIKPENNS